MGNPYQVVRDFEAALCKYTGAPFAVTTNSCTMALTLAVAWHLKDRKPRCEVCGIQPTVGMRWDCPRQPCGWKSIGSNEVEIPKRTYVGVPYAIREAGGRPTFRDEDWKGNYRLGTLPVWDSARWFTGNLWGNIPDPFPLRTMVCVSFHASKTLGHSQGGAILHDDPEADRWLRRARFDGREEGIPPAKDFFPMRRAWHCYMSADVAAALHLKLHHLPRQNEPLPNDAYPDLSQMEVFR